MAEDKTQLKKRQDKEDLAKAQKPPEKRTSELPWYKSAGPGLITGAADDDPSGVATYSANGAQFGYQLLWLAPVCIPLMIAVQEMCGRLAAVTGKGLAAVIKETFPPWVLYTSVGMLVVANIFNVYADLNMIAASAKMLFGLPTWVGLLGFTAFLVATQIFIPYHKYAQVLKWLCLSLLGYVVVVFMPGMKNNWHAIGRGLFVPSINLKIDVILAVVAFLGTTISPYLFFWQAGETVEEAVAEGLKDGHGTRKFKADSAALRRIRSDTSMGMVISQLVAVFMIIAASGTIHASGKTQIDSAQDAAKALAPLGPAAVWIFTICIIGTGLLAIPTLAGSAAYGLAETFGWRFGLYRRFARARAFYITIAVVIILGWLMNLVGSISPVKALIYSAAMNGVIAPPLIVLLLLICRNPKVVGDKVNGKWSNGFGIAAVVLMGGAAIIFLYALVTHQV